MLSQIANANEKLKIICVDKVKLYNIPSIKSKHNGYLYRNTVVRVIKIIKTKKSYDFAKIIHKKKVRYIPLQYISNIPSNNYIYQNRNIVIGSAHINKYNPIPLKYKPNDLIRIPNRYMVYKKNAFLRKKAYNAFKAMIDDARKKGIIIKLVSCYRSSRLQEWLYKRAVKRNPKQSSSAKPGHSEHQLGTTADISSPEVGYRLTKKLYNTKTHNWIKLNAKKYGIYISYPKNNTKGYDWEPWHLRYWGKSKTFANHYSD